MKAIPLIAALLLASTSVAQPAYELPRPTVLTVTNGLVECADAAGCVVQRACGAPKMPFADSDFAQVGDPLAEGETLETPRTNSRAETCAVRVVRNDGTTDGATANIVGLRYVKLRQASDAFHVVGVAEVPVHRARTVTSMEMPAPPATSGGNLLGYLLERYGVTLADIADEKCSHIRRDHRREYDDCVYREVEVLASHMVAVPDESYTRCLVDVVELYCNDTAMECREDSVVEEALLGRERILFDLSRLGDDSGTSYQSNRHRYSGVPAARDRYDECRALAKDVYERLGFAVTTGACHPDADWCWPEPEDD